jgi:hypothetical protein
MQMIERLPHEYDQCLSEEGVGRHLFNRDNSRQIFNPILKILRKYRLQCGKQYDSQQRNS